MSEYILELKDVNFKYENAPTVEEPALKNINLKVKKGEFIGVIGSNNSGKSTLCALCNGLIPKALDGEFSGQVLVDGQDIKDVSTAKMSQKVGLVLPDPEAQLSQLTVYDELTFGPSNLELPREKIFEEADRVMKLIKLENFKERSPFSLSGGEQQRVAIASVLAMNPEILVLDEPTSNLDPLSTQEIFEIICKLNREMNMTVILVEHEVELMAQYVDRFVVMDNGRIVLDGSPKEVFSHREVFEQIKMFIPTVTSLAGEIDEEYRKWGNYEYPITLEEMIKIIDSRKE
ncbi:MAG: ATP-binding cassette domain-containing protein [Erysipelotrichaceae bacterium]|nr:ATP-binding cassette domain-containing protein [Erysipelotrichaceae bacterium]